MEFVPMVQINNILALVQIMAWHQTGDKPLSELMMASFTDSYITEAEWVQSQTQCKIVIENSFTVKSLLQGTPNPQT